MPRLQPPEGYYTASEAIEVLGVNEGAFYNYVRNKTLTREVFVGRKQGFYLKSEVDALAEAIRRQYPQIGSAK